MSIKVLESKRVFKFNGKTHEDPNPSLTPDEVLEYFSETDIKLTTAVVTKPVYNEEKNVTEFEFKSEMKSKG